MRSPCDRRGGSAVRAAVVTIFVAVLLSAVPADALQNGADRQLTTTGDLVDLTDSAGEADVAYNTRTGESLVVYSATEASPSPQWEVYGQRLTATGEPIGPRLTLGGVGVDTDPNFVRPEPAVAYSATSGRWMVVFSIDDQQLSRPNDKFEVFARTVTDAGTVGTSLIGVSETGQNDDAGDDAQHPDIAWNPDDNQFLVAWDARQNDVGLYDSIRIQRLSGIGTVLGGDQIISGIGGTGGDTPRNRPAVAYGATAQRGLAVWFGEPTPDCCKEQELIGQLLLRTGAATGPNDFHVTKTGVEGDREANAGIIPGDGVTSPPPDLIFDPIANRFIAVYMGDPGTGGMVAGKHEAFAQRVNPAGTRDGDAVRLSQTPPNDASTTGANAPAIARDPLSGESVVLWWAVPGQAPFAAGEREIFGQRLAAAAVPLGGDFRAGQTGPDGQAATGSQRPAAAGFPGGYQAVWDGRPTGFKLELHGDQLHLPSLSLGDLTVAESAGTANVPVTVTNPDPAGVPISVTAATAPGSALAGTDYLHQAGPLSLPALAAAATFDVPIVPDAAVEPTESFTATLSAPSGAILGDGQATVTVTDDDEAPSPPEPGSGTATTPGLAGTTITPGPTGTPTTRDPAKLQVLRAQVRRGRLDVLAQITARATGTIRMSFRSGGRTTQFDAAISSGGRIQVDRLLPAVQRRRTTGILTIVYGGNARVRPDDVRLRAASGKALLTRDVARINSRRLEVSGTISRRARGVVRLRLAYVEADGDITELSYRARIVIPRSGAGRWSIREALPARAAAVGGQVDIQFTGYEPQLIRGEQLSKQVDP